MGVMLFKYIIIPVIGRTPEAGAQTVCYFNSCRLVIDVNLSHRIQVDVWNFLFSASGATLLLGE
jgi:hypothetical protein